MSFAVLNIKDVACKSLKYFFTFLFLCWLNLWCKIKQKLLYFGNSFVILDNGRRYYTFFEDNHCKQFNFKHVFFF